MGDRVLIDVVKKEEILIWIWNNLFLELKGNDAASMIRKIRT